MITILTANDWKKLTSDTDNSSVTDALEKVHAAETIYDRFDALIRLAERCHSFLIKNPNNKPALELKENALKFSSAIVDAKDLDELAIKVKNRNEYKKIDPKYMPWPVPSTRLDVTQFSDHSSYEEALVKHHKKMQKQKKYGEVNSEDAKGDLKYNVKYLTEKEREAYRIFINDSQFKQITQDETGKLVLKNFDTTHYNAHGDDQFAIFVISPEGEIFAGNTINYAFFHSSFLAGHPTAYAGTMAVDDGDLTDLDTHSGHYKTDLNQVMHIFRFFRQHNLLKNIGKFEMFDYDNENVDPDRAFLEYPIRSGDEFEDYEKQLNKQLQAYNKIYRQKAESYATPYIKQFNNDDDKVLYKINLLKKMKNHPAISQLATLAKQAYIETVIDSQAKKLFTNQEYSTVLQANFSRLAKTLAKKKENLIAYHDDIALITKPVKDKLEYIKKQSKFIFQQSLTYGNAEVDAKASAVWFVDIIVKKAVQMVDQPSNESLDDYIFETKMKMAIQLYLKQKGITSDKIIIDEFHRQVKVNIAETLHLHTNNNDHYITQAINDAGVLLKLRNEEANRKFANILAQPFIDNLSEKKQVNEFQTRVRKKLLNVSSLADLPEIFKETYCEIKVEETSQEIYKEEAAVQQAFFSRLANTFVKLNLKANSIKEINSNLDTILNVTKEIMLKIDKESHFIHQQVMQIGLDENEAKILSLAFINHIAQQAINNAANNNFSKDLADAIFETKMRMCIDLYAQQLADSHTDKVVEMFGSRVKKSLKNAAKNDQSIITAIANATNFIVLESQLLDQLMKAIDELQRLKANEDFLLENEVIGTINAICDEINKVENITSLAEMEAKFKRLIEEATTAKKFFLVNNEQQQLFFSAKMGLKEILDKGKYYFAADKIDSIYGELNMCRHLSEVIECANKLLKNGMIQDRGMMSSLFKNPVKVQVINFVKNCEGMLSLKKQNKVAVS